MEHDLNTPALLVDLDIVERNLANWQKFCDRHGLACRPHVKTHKSVDLGLQQVRLGAVGITCQKLGEAEVMVDGGIDDVLIPYNVVGAAKLVRLTALARRAGVSVTADDPRVVRSLADAAGADGVLLTVLVDCDTGFGRTGVQTPTAGAALARDIARADALAFGGFLTHPATPTCSAFLAAARDETRRLGIETPAVSVGGKAMMWTAPQLQPVITEYRAGTYIFLDRNAVAAGIGRAEDIAVTVAATVVSQPTPTRAIIDTGTKSLSASTAPDGLMGALLEAPYAEVYALNEEHGYVRLPPETPLELGQQIRVVPNDVSAAVNLFDWMHVTRGGRMIETWPVDARGRSD